MSVLIFQSVPERYDLRQKLIPGTTDTWWATRYRNEMTLGSIVLFWMGGDETFRGLYGWGHLTSTPYINPGWESYGVDVAYDVKFERPILATTLRGDVELSKMLILRAPHATNFLLTESQSERLLSLIRERGEHAPRRVS